MARDPRSRRLSFKRLASLCLVGAAWRAPAAAAEPGLRGWRMNVPNGYRHEVEDDGATIVLTPPNPDQFLMRFTFHSLKAYARERPKVGREFIEHLARKKGVATFPVDGNGGLAFIETAVPSDQGGVRAQETLGGLGLASAYVTFTVVIDEAALGDPVVRELLGSGLRVLLGRIRAD